MKKIYLDVCALCRPYDDQTYTRIHLENIAVQLILGSVEKGLYHLVYSPVHEKEIFSISDDFERYDLFYLLRENAIKIPTAGSQQRKRADELVSYGLGIADAAHLAYAEIEGAEFVSCDDKLLKRCAKTNVKIWVGNPLMFCDKEDLK